MKYKPLTEFLFEHFVLSWPAFVMGLAVGAFTSCRSVSTAVEAIVLGGAAAVIGICTAGEYFVLRRYRREVRMLCEDIERGRRK